MSEVPSAGLPGHTGCQGIRLVWRQGGRPGRQGSVSGDHGVASLQVPALHRSPTADPHLVRVAGFQHDQGDGAGGVRVRSLCMPRLPSRRISIHQFSKVAFLSGDVVCSHST